MKKAQIIVRNTLLAFVLISIGFALGKDVTVRRQAYGSAKAAGSNSELRTENSELKVVVTYLHTTFRCVTCNEIERLAKTLVETEFAAELSAGRIAWREVNFQLDEALAKRYGVIANCVVVAKIEDGRETAFQRLDDTWTLYQKPTEFNAYVGKVIKQYLKKGEVEQ